MIHLRDMIIAGCAALSLSGCEYTPDKGTKIYEAPLSCATGALLVDGNYNITENIGHSVGTLIFECYDESEAVRVRISMGQAYEVLLCFEGQECKDVLNYSLRELDP